MTLQESFPELANWSVEFIATDIAQHVLARAEAGIYSQFEVQRGLPIQMLMKYFEQCPAGWQVKESLRKRVRFRSLNLLENFQHLGRFDIIFCRNVLIYFDLPTKKRILDRLADLLRSDGYLLLGAAETVLGICERFERRRDSGSAIYTPKPGKAA
jgi:chemotaxis protein methyltransferase CheR